MIRDFVFILSKSIIVFFFFYTNDSGIIEDNFLLNLIENLNKGS
jgi:hypothetical protein